MAVSIGWSTLLVQAKIFSQILDGLPWNWIRHSWSLENESYTDFDDPLTCSVTTVMEF